MFLVYEEAIRDRWLEGHVGIKMTLNFTWKLTKALAKMGVLLN